MDKKTLASTLKRLRESAGLTQSEVAAFAGKKQQTVASWEAGQSQPDVITLFSLCKYYGADINRDFGLSSMQISEGITIPEKQQIKKYRALDKHGKDLVSTVLEKEYQRCTAIDDTVQLRAVARTRDGKALNMEDVPKFTRAQLDSMEKDLDDLLADGPEKLP